jgi:hemerythrin-like domain-containing protein
MLLTNILREMYIIASGFGWLAPVKVFILDIFKDIVPEFKKVLPGIRKNLQQVLTDINSETKKGVEASKPVSGYIDRFFDNIRQHVNIELEYILTPIIEFIEKVEKIDENGLADGNKLEKYIEAFT